MMPKYPKVTGILLFDVGKVILCMLTILSMNIGGFIWRFV